MSNKFKPVVLLILDGWGIAPQSPGNAIEKAKKPNMDNLLKVSLRTQLIAHGESVGLPRREPGNTETGHLNIGAGSIVYQDLPRINMSIADGSFFQNPALVKTVEHLKKSSGKLHLMGLIGGGGVHSDLTHFYAILRFCKEQLVDNVCIHAFTDGRDSPPNSAKTFLDELSEVINKEGIGKICTLMGRYYAMDRDFRWDRTQIAYDCLTQGTGSKFESYEKAIEESYKQGKTDEFIEPIHILKPGEKPNTIEDNDAVIFVNFRIDRPRQLTKAFVLPDFKNQGNKSGFDPYAIKYGSKHEVDSKNLRKPFERTIYRQNLFFVTMTEYEENLPVTIAYPPQSVDFPLGKIVSDYGLSQLRMAESEKERFVTYYFNGLRNDSFVGEDRIIVASPHIPTYDKKPQMSVYELTDRLISEISQNKYDLIVVNFANADMVGHTGNLDACIKACESIDENIGKIVSKIDEVGGALLITADHGNAEEMIDLTTGMPDTEHNANPVPFIVYAKNINTQKTIEQGILADIAPSVLHLMGIPAPITMSGRNILSSAL